MAVAAPEHQNMISDEEFARQLQQEEFRSALTGPFNFGRNRSSNNNSTDPSQDISAPLLNDNNGVLANPLLNDAQNPNAVGAIPAGPNGGNAAQRARRNVISHVRDTDTDSPRILLFRITIALLEIIATACVLAIGWDEGDGSECAPYLKYWVLFYTMRQFVMIPLRIHIFRINRRSSNNDNDDSDGSQQRDREAAEKSTSVLRCFAILTFLLFLLGQTFLFTEKECQNISPTVWYYCLVIIILVYVSLALPFLIVLAICICLPCVLIIFRFFAEPEGADDRAIKNLPTRKIVAADLNRGGDDGNPDAKEDDDSDGPSCAICMQEYKVDDELRILPCQHEFHTQCVDKWLPMKKICPLCRHDVTKSVCPPCNDNNAQNAQNAVSIPNDNEDNV